MPPSVITPAIVAAARSFNFVIIMVWITPFASAVAVAEARDPSNTLVREIMSPGTICVRDDDPVEDAVRVMEEHQIRRAPVLNHDNKLVGIVSLGDIAVDASASLSGAVRPTDSMDSTSSMLASRILACCRRTTCRAATLCATRYTHVRIEHRPSKYAKLRHTCR